MRGLPAAGSGASFRTRRWDIVILGGALPGLVAATAAARHGLRVLVVEEDAAVRAHAGLREPFFSTVADRESVLGSCLRELGVAQIERRNIGSTPLAYQVVFPDARVDIGTPAVSTDELVAWGFAKPESARNLLAGIARAAKTERKSMLTAPVVRASRLRLRSRTRHDAKPAPLDPGLSEELARVSPRMQRLLDAQIRGLSHTGTSGGTPGTRARLLGLALEGASSANSIDRGVPALVRRRLEKLHGEFRTLPAGFRLVDAGGRPGIAVAEEIWAGRVLVLNAPRSLLAAALVPQRISWLDDGPIATAKRVQLQLRLGRERLPEGMAPRVIRVAEPERDGWGEHVVTVRVFPSADPGSVDLVASAVVAVEADTAAVEAELLGAIQQLIPFSEEHVSRVSVTGPRWDRDGPLFDPPAGGHWPATCDLRVAARTPIYILERGAVGELGDEGDLLLGWRAGDAIARDLA